MRSKGCDCELGNGRRGADPVVKKAALPSSAWRREVAIINEDRHHRDVAKKVAGYLQNALKNENAVVSSTTGRARHDEPFPLPSPHLPPPLLLHLPPLGFPVFLVRSHPVFVQAFLPFLPDDLGEEAFDPFADRESGGEAGRAHADESDEVGEGGVGVDDAEVGVGGGGGSCRVERRAGK